MDPLSKKIADTGCEVPGCYHGSAYRRSIRRKNI